MKVWQNNSTLILSLLMYVMLWWFLHPILGYMLDSDCVSYLTIAERFAKGDFAKSINGLWSPLNSYLMAPFIRAGFNTWKGAQALNCFFGGVLILQSFYLFKLFIHNRWQTFLYLVSIPIVMVYMVYYQMFGDVLQLIFVLAYLQFFLSYSFLQKPSYAILCGAIMAIGFYAKAYSFVFFILHYSIGLAWIFWNDSSSKKQIIQQYVLGIFTFLIGILPWSWVIFSKYKIWSLSGLAGKLNMSWYINSGKSFKSDITLLIPPTYKDSPSFWEDPYLSQTNLSTPFSSVHHFLKWMARVAYTSVETLICFNEISLFALVILGISLYVFFKNKSKQNLRVQLLVMSCCILPMGYMLMHIETRYIWLCTFLLFILGFLLLNLVQLPKRMFAIASVILAFSFIAFPIIQIKKLKYKNQDLFEKAAWLNEKNIHGTFTSNIADAGQMWVVAYLTHNQFYTIEKLDYSADELIKELQRYRIDYFLFQAENNAVPLKMESPFFEKIDSKYGINLYKIKHEILPKP